MYIDEALKKISEQQKGLEGTPAFYVGEQLKQICSSSEKISEIVLTDLNNPDMSIVKAEKQIQKYSDDNHKSARCFCVPPDVAEKIIKKFYGIDGIASEDLLNTTKDEFLNLEDFLE